jgi:hypothetical protein
MTDKLAVVSASPEARAALLTLFREAILALTRRFAPAAMAVTGVSTATLTDISNSLGESADDGDIEEEEESGSTAGIVIAATVGGVLAVALVALVLVHSKRSAGGVKTSSRYGQSQRKPPGVFVGSNPAVGRGSGHHNVI